VVERNPQLARQRIVVGARSRRRFEERVALRLPPVAALVARAMSSLSPNSRLRRALVGRIARLGVEATNRGDFEAAFAFYHPDIEVVEPPQVTNLGLDPVSRGREGRILVQRRWQAEWGEFRLEPEHLTDLGDRLLLVSRMKGRGLASGAAFDSDMANLLTLSAGRIIREEMFLDRNQAFAAVGLAELGQAGEKPG
jgi:ketosteroid isomerase-like protein